MNCSEKRKKNLNMTVQKNNFADMVFKCRGLVWGVFSVIALIFPSHFNLSRFLFGLTLLLLGQLFRFWAAGFIPNYRTRTIGASKLVVWGPYQWIRNPLYLGNYIMGAGWTLMLGWHCVLAFSAAFLTLYLLIVIPAEEKFLESKFGREYEEYKESVPSLIPYKFKGFVKANPDECIFDKKTAWRSEVYSLRMNLIVTVAIFIKLFYI